MGTTYHITLSNPDSSLDLSHLQNKIDAELLKINQLMSTYISDSEISHFNQFPVGEWFQLSPETFSVLAYSLSLSDKTQGQFDITVAPLINLWGFGHKKMNSFPADSEIGEAMSLVGWQFIELDSQTLRAKKNKMLSINMSAVAKGYGVDHIASLLDEQSVNNYLVEIGGEIKVKGVSSRGDLWKIGIETPSFHQTGTQKVIALKNKAVATSGDYRNFFEHEGVRYSHTINPVTGKPVIHTIASLTVIRGSTMEADALATAFMAMGKESALKMAKVYNIPVYILSYDNDTFTASFSPAFNEYLH